MDQYDRVEIQRQALEENLRKLRQSLKYWQTFEAEYEGLKEDIQDALPDVDGQKLLSLSKNYPGELVTEQVVRELAGLDKAATTAASPPPPRSAQQVIRDIERRQEYVQRNVEIIQRRFFDAEAKLEEFDFAATRDAGTGLPLTEIEEELDDDDNVISSRVTRPEESQSKLVESLRKAGLAKSDLDKVANGDAPEKAPPLKPAITNATTSPASNNPPAIAPTVAERRSKPALGLSSGDSCNDEHTPERPPIRKKSVSFTADTKAAPEIVRFEHEDGRKSVTFADKVAIAPAAPMPDTRTVQFSPKVEEIPAQPQVSPSPEITATQVGAAHTEAQKDLRASFKPGDKVKTLNDDDEVVAEDVVLPENESPEDAQTRREMLDYHLHEVGHVVAQMDIEDADYYDDEGEAEHDSEDADSHWTGSSYLGDEDTPYTSGFSDESDDFEEEDEYGRTKGRVLSDEYHKEMQEMQKRLQNHFIGNLGPAPRDDEITDIDAELDPEDVRRLVVRDNTNSTQSTSVLDSSDKKVGGKKRVSFAESLDVSDAPPPTKALKHDQEQNAVPVADAVMERSGASQITPPAVNTPSKPSRFKKTLVLAEDDLNDTPLGPPGKTLADTLVERPAPAKSSIPPSLDDPDPITERRQLAAEYYRRRNEIVRQQGGFKIDPEEEQELGELMEERDGKVRKVSKFKAARIKPLS